MTSFGIPKITTEGLGIPCGIPGDVDSVGRLWTPIDAKALYLLDFRHKKKTSVDVFRCKFGGAGGI